MEQFLLNLGKTSFLGVLMIAAILAAKPLWKERYRAKARCWLWLALAVFLLLPVDLSTEDAPVQVTPPKDYTVFVGTDKTTVIATDSLFGDIAERHGQTPVQMRDTVNKQLSADTGRNPSRYIPVTAAIFWLWAAGAAVFLVRQGVVYARFRRTVRRWRREVTREDYTALLDSTAQELNVTAPRMLICEAVTTPAVTGVLRPTLLLPHENYDLGMLRFILRHELCHLKRRDMLLKLVLLAANAMHWFNPMVYLMLRQADEDIELACDSAATDGLTRGERADYGRVLLSAAQAANRTVPATTCFGGTIERLKRRIENVLGAQKKRGLWLVALVLAATLAAGCAVGWGSKDTEASLFDGSRYNAVFVAGDASLSAGASYDPLQGNSQFLQLVRTDGANQVSITRSNGASVFPAMEPVTLTEENFDGTWLPDLVALRGDNKAAWRYKSLDDIDDQDAEAAPNLGFLLEQKDGSLYLCFGYRLKDGAERIRWIYRLEKEDDTLYSSMEDYAASVIDALKQSDGYTYYIVGEDDLSVVVTEAAADVRVTELTKLGDCTDLAPEGVLELWRFSYEVKPEDKASALPDRFFWVGGNRISNDGYISDGFYYYLTMLRTDNDPSVYKLLDSQRAKDGLWYNGCGYEDSAAYLHDFYVDYAGLDLPTMIIPNPLSGTAADGYGYEDRVEAQLTSGDGWYLYVPTVAWMKTDGEDSWYSLYYTSSALRVDKSVDSVEMMEQFYLDGGFTLEQYRKGAALSGPWRRFDTDSGTQFEMYLVPNTEEGGCYIISTYWTPTDDDSVNEWGYSRKKQIEKEAVVLRAMAQSFTVAPELKDQYEPSFDEDIALASNGGAAWLYLIEDGKHIGGFDAGVAWNIPTLNSYNYVLCDAPEETSSKITLLLSNNDSSHLEFYKGTNVVGYFVGGENEGSYYMADGDFSIVNGDGRTLYDVMRTWYGEAEFCTLRDEVEETPIPNRGQSWEEAAKEYLDAYEGVHLQVRSGSQFKFTWVKNLVEPAEDMMELKRKRGELEENEYYFYATTEFVAESELALGYAMAGNTGGCDDPDAPEGAYEYYRCCTIRLEEDGWHGTVWGTGW